MSHLGPQPWNAFAATPANWADWRWQMRFAARTADELHRFVRLTPDEEAGIRDTAGVFRLAVTPYYLNLIDPVNPYCPVRMQSIPVRREARIRPNELADPLGEDSHRPVPAIVHKYPDRVLLLATDRCSVYCRHCTRRRITGGAEPELDKAALRQASAYIASHREVRDVLISGGDPLLLSTPRLVELLSAIRESPHVEIIRIGTRMPVCCPMRIDAELTAALRRFHPLFVVTHFNHAKELTSEARAACEALVDAGIPVENQTVLLRRVNSTARAIADLNQRLLTARVRPYYLHQCDVAEGLEHLRTPVEKGIEILDALRGWTSGLAVPHFAVDLPGGGGKVTLQPQYLVAAGLETWTFRNYRGDTYRYPQPEERDCECPYDEVFYGAGDCVAAGGGSQ
jgi:lysine 2,3-aminomutase